MAVFSYEELKEAARKARAEMAEEGRYTGRRLRRKPRDTEKRALLFQKAVERIKRYPPCWTETGLLLPYFRQESEDSEEEL